MQKNLNSKGMTLVEVVVALTILIVAFSISVGLIIGVINLAVLAKSRTEASGLLQMGISDGVSAVSENGCVEIPPSMKTPYSITVDRRGFSRTAGAGDDGKTIYVYFNKDKNADGDYHDNWSSGIGGDDGITADKYTKVTAVVKWTYKGDPMTAEAVQYVRKK